MIKDIWLNNKPVVALALTGLFFPVGYIFCAIYHSMNLVVSLIMSLIFIIIIFLLINNISDVLNLLFFFNMLSLGYIFGYIIPLLKKGFLNKDIPIAYKKIIIIVARSFALLIMLIPMSIIPIHFANVRWGSNIGIIIQDGSVYSLSWVEALSVIVLTIFWYILATYTYFRKDSYFI